MNLSASPLNTPITFLRLLVVLALSAALMTAGSIPAGAQEERGEEPQAQEERGEESQSEPSDPLDEPPATDLPEELGLEVLDASLQTNIACSVNAYTPSKSSGRISGRGVMTCTHAVDHIGVRVCIQRHRWYGWETLSCNNRDRLAQRTADYTHDHGCQSGTWTYRTAARGYVTHKGVAYSTGWVASSGYRTSC